LARSSLLAFTRSVFFSLDAGMTVWNGKPLKRPSAWRLLAMPSIFSSYAYAS
jgi:hypothetical protein